MTTSTSVPDPRRWWALFLLCTAQFLVAFAIGACAQPSSQRHGEHDAVATPAPTARHPAHPAPPPLEPVPTPDAGAAASSPEPGAPVGAPVAAPVEDPPVEGKPTTPVRPRPRKQPKAAAGSAPGAAPVIHAHDDHGAQGAQCADSGSGSGSGSGSAAHHGHHAP